MTHVTEGRAHDDGLVAVRLVVVEDLLDGLDTGVLSTRVRLAGLRLVPVKNLWMQISTSMRMKKGNCNVHDQRTAR